MTEQEVFSLKLEFDEAGARKADDSLSKLEKKLDAVADANDKLNKGTVTTGGLIGSLGEKFAAFRAKVGTAVSGLRDWLDADKEVAKGTEKSKINAEELGKAYSKLFDSLKGGRPDLDKLGATFKEISTAGGGAGVALGIVGGAAVVATLAIAGTGAALAAFAVQGSDLAGEMYDLSLNTGIATDKLGLYKIAAEQSGTSVDALAKGVETVERRLQEAAGGNKNLIAVFDALGVSAKGAATDPAAAFETLAAKIGKIEDPLLRAKAAQEIFGRGGVDLISTFVTMAEEGESLRKRMDALGITLGTDTAKGADALGDELVVLGALVDSFKIKVAEQAAPSIVLGLGAIESLLVKLQPLTDYVVTPLAFSFAKVAVEVNAAADALARLLGIQRQTPSDEGQFVGTKNGQPDKSSPNYQPFTPDAYTQLRLALAKGTKRSGGSGSSLINANLAEERAALDDEVKLIKDHLSRQQSILQDGYDFGLISTRKFYDEKLRLTEVGLETELNAVRLEIQAAEEARERALKLPSKQRGTEVSRLDRQLGNLRTEEIIKFNALVDAGRINLTEFKKALGSFPEIDLSKQEQVLKEFFDATTGRTTSFEKLTPIQQSARAKLGTYTERASNEDLYRNEFERDRERIQTRLVTGVISESAARREVLELERQYSDLQIGVLEAKKELAGLDKAAIADLDAQIERLKQMGVELSSRDSFAKGISSGVRSNSQNFEALGQDIQSAIKRGVATGFKQGAREGAVSLLDALADAFLNFAIEQATAPLFEKLGNLFRTPPINPNSSKTGTTKAAGSLGGAVDPTGAHVSSLDMKSTTIISLLQQIAGTSATSAALAQSAEDRLVAQATTPQSWKSILGGIGLEFAGNLLGGLGGALAGKIGGGNKAQKAGYYNHNISVGYGGGRAFGGPVETDTMYQWQESGREFFIPKVPGTVVPESKLPRSTVVNITIHAKDVDSFQRSKAQIAREMRRAVEDEGRFR